MNIKHKISLLLSIFCLTTTWAQDELLNQLDTIKSTEKQIEIAAFKGLQICNLQSTKLPAKHEWYVLISHRFGDLTQGFDNFFGLDEANTKIGAIYGATNWLSIGFSRETSNKIYEFASKIKFADQQTNGFPFTIVAYNTVDINSKLKTNEYPNLKTNNRFAYSNQLLVSRKFSNAISLEIAPIYIHKNLYDPETELKDQFLVAAGGRFKISKRMSLNIEYAKRINAPENTIFHDPLSAGLDIETGGHVFQMVLSNSQVMNDVAVFSKAQGNWNGGGIYFGFNMYRVF